MVSTADQDIFGFDVTVKNIALVDMNQRAGHLFDVASHLFLIEFLPLPKLLEKLALGCVFHDVINFAGVEEEPVHLQNVGVVEVSVDLYFPANLANHLRVHNLFHRQHLDSYDMFRGSLSC